MSELMIGWSEADITPDINGKPIPLNGQYYARTARGIHSRLKSVVVAISSGEEYDIVPSTPKSAPPMPQAYMIRRTRSESFVRPRR